MLCQNMHTPGGNYPAGMLVAKTKNIGNQPSAPEPNKRYKFNWLRHWTAQGQIAQEHRDSQAVLLGLAVQARIRAVLPYAAIP